VKHGMIFPFLDYVDRCGLVGYCRLCLHSSTFQNKFCLLGLMVVFGLGFKSSLN
jgi:hypothetical protein